MDWELAFCVLQKDSEDPYEGFDVYLGNYSSIAVGTLERLQNL